MRLATIAGGLAAITLLTAAAAAQQAPDPMTALIGAPQYSALPRPPEPAETAPAPAAAAAYDPMRAASQPQGPDAQSAEQVAEAAGQGAPNPELGGLPDGPGAEETYYQCVACHSTAIIMQQRVTDVRWDYLWRWMIEDQGMIEPDEETAEIILTYLKQHFSSER